MNVGVLLNGEEESLLGRGPGRESERRDVGGIDRRHVADCLGLGGCFGGRGGKQGPPEAPNL